LSHGVISFSTLRCIGRASRDSSGLRRWRRASWWATVATVRRPRAQPEPLAKVLVELKRRFRPHAIVLYGSRARGAGTASSDWDLFLLRKGPRERHVRDFDGLALDVF